jgi:hypothetical protein
MVVTMAVAGNNAPIIIKRKKVVQGGGHHGGAWKVAIKVSFGSSAFAPIEVFAQWGGAFTSF